jgi:hypothetical protein
MSDCKRAAEHFVIGVLWYQQLVDCGKTFLYGGRLDVK